MTAFINYPQYYLDAVNASITEMFYREIFHHKVLLLASIITGEPHIYIEEILE